MMRFASPLLAAILGVAASATGAVAQATIPTGAPAAAFPNPDRPVAEIISPVWADERQRDGVDEVGQLARLLAIGPGMRVADLGAGSGYHTVRLSRIVGPTGRIYAEDVIQSYLAELGARVATERLENVTVVAGEAHDPCLQPASVDVAILVHMYHEISQPFAFLYNLVPALRSGARIGIVDLDRRTENHGTPPRLLRCELEAVGYRQTGFHRLKGGLGYLAIFEPPSLEARPQPASVKPCSSGRR